jgi:hypothetical protein
MRRRQMAQNSKVLTAEANRVSLVSAGPAAAQEDYLGIAEREAPVNTVEQNWIFGVGEESRVTRIIPKLANTLVKSISWLGRVGSGKINDSYLGARHDIHHNVRINGIGL